LHDSAAWPDLDRLQRRRPITARAAATVRVCTEEFLSGVRDRSRDRRYWVRVPVASLACACALGRRLASGIQSMSGLPRPALTPVSPVREAAGGVPIVGSVRTCSAMDSLTQPTVVAPLFQEYS